MVLLRGAERTRRLVICVVAVTACAAQALRPVESVEDVATLPVAALQSITMPLAAAAYGMLHAPPSAEEREPPARGLVDVERSSGRPREVAGAAWLEVPVLEVAARDGELLLGGGSELHLVSGMPVAFGASYLGRLIEVEEGSSRVRLAQAADARSGVLLRATPETAGVRAVAIGRASGEPPMLGLVEPGARLFEDSEVLWRPAEDDALALGGGGLRLGTLRQEQDEEARRSTWVVELDRPAGAEGRVWVLAGAVGDRLLAERRTTVERAAPLLRADAVHGAGWAALRAGSAPVGAVLTSGPRVVGTLALRRGGVAWLRRRAPARWGSAAVAVSGDPAVILPADHEEASVAQLYTRGGGVVPRGLWLGAPEDPAAPLATPLRVHAAESADGR